MSKARPTQTSPSPSTHHGLNQESTKTRPDQTLLSPSSMASISSSSSICSSSSTIRRFKHSPFSTPHHHHHLPIRPNPSHLRPTQSIARDTPSSLNQFQSLSLPKNSLQKDPLPLWNRYVDWLYQHKDLGLFLDVSRIGFTDEFLTQMEPRLQTTFLAMQELDKGAIANPDEGRMVEHYWLRNPQLAPNSFLRSQIQWTLDAVCRFAEDVIGGKIRFIDNTDRAGIDHQIAQPGDELASTLVIVISKSGGTPETRNGLLEVQKAFCEAGLVFSKQGVAIT